MSYSPHKAPNKPIQVPIRTNIENYTHTIDHAGTEDLPQHEPPLQRRFHLYQKLFEDMMFDSSSQILDLFTNFALFSENNSNNDQINPMSDETNQNDHNDDSTPLSFDFKTSIQVIQEDFLKNQFQNEEQTHKQMNLLDTYLFELEILISNILTQKLQLKPTGDFTDPYAYTGTWFQPFPLTSTNPEAAELYELELLAKKNKQNFGSKNNPQINPDQESEFHVRDIVAPKYGSITDEVFLLAMLRALIVKRRLAFIHIKKTFSFSLARMRTQIFQSAQFHFDLIHIATHFPLSLPHYLDQKIRDTLHYKHLSEFLSRGKLTLQQIEFTQQNNTKNRSNLTQKNKFFEIFQFFNYGTLSTSYSFTSRLLSNALQPKSSYNSITLQHNFFSGGIYALQAENPDQNSAFFQPSSQNQQQQQNSQHQQIRSFANLIRLKYSSLPSQLGITLRKADISDSSSAPLNGYLPQRHSVNNFLPESKIAKNSQTFQGKTTFISKDESGKILFFTAPLPPIRLTKGKGWLDKKVIDDGSLNSMNDDDENEKNDENEKKTSKSEKFLKTDLFSVPINDCIDKNNWKNVLQSLQRDQQQQLTTSLLRRLQLESSLLHSGVSQPHEHAISLTKPNLFAENLNSDKNIDKNDQNGEQNKDKNPNIDNQIATIPAIGSTYNTGWLLAPDVFCINHPDYIQVNFLGQFYKTQNNDANNSEKKNSKSLLQDSKKNPNNFSQLDSILNNDNVYNNPNETIFHGFKLWLTTGQLTFLEEHKQYHNFSHENSQFFKNDNNPQHKNLPNSIMLPDLISQQESTSTNLTYSPQYTPQTFEDTIGIEISRIFLILHYLFFSIFSQNSTLFSHLPLLQKLNLSSYQSLFLSPPSHYIQSVQTVQAKMGTGASKSGEEGEKTNPTANLTSPALTETKVQSYDYALLNPKQFNEQDSFSINLLVQQFYAIQLKTIAQNSFFSTEFSNSIRNYDSNSLHSTPTTITITQSASMNGLIAAGGDMGGYNRVVVKPIVSNNISQAFSGLNTAKPAQMSTPHTSLLLILVLYIKDYTTITLFHAKIKHIKEQLLTPWNDKQRYRKNIVGNSNFGHFQQNNNGIKNAHNFTQHNLFISAISNTQVKKTLPKMYITISEVNCNSDSGTIESSRNSAQKNVRFGVDLFVTFI